jgi:anti-sigma regulatory factor (Ser/Thr protein kinase)
VRFGADDLRPVRRVTAPSAARAGLPASRAEDFVTAVSEIAANAVRHGSPAASGNGRSGGRGRALARLVCDGVGIRAGAAGTTVILRMNLPARRGGRAAVTGLGAVVLPVPGPAALAPAGPGGRLRGAGRMDGRRIGA